MQLLKTILLWISRLLIGFTFIFSGFVKAIDPVGTSIKFGDYFSAMHLDFFAPYALMFAFMLAAVEFLLGVNLLLSLSPRHSSYYVLAVMAFMTPLTLYLAIANPVSDCGCFGDAVKLTNWETFGKNIILMAAAIYFFIHRKSVPHLYHHKIHWIPSILAFLFAISISYRSYTHLPDFDFLPYKIGANITAGMTIPKGAVSDVYETTFIYEKKGEKKEFTLQNYPANDSAWHFVNQKSVLVKKGVEPAIHDFTITLKETGEEITDRVLADSSYTFLLVSPKFGKASDTYIDQINDIFDYSVDKGLSFYALTSSTEEEIKDWIDGTGAEYPICFTDETTLKTMIRANPGLVLLHKGTVVGKWNSVDIPTEEEMGRYIEKVKNGEITNRTQEEKALIRKTITVILIFLVSLLAIDKLILAISNRRKKIKNTKEIHINTNN